MRLDVHGNAVSLRHRHDLTIDAAHVIQRFALGHSRGRVAVVGGVDAWHAGELRPPDRVEHVLDAERGAFGFRKRKRRVDLRETDAVTVHLPAQQERVFPERDVRLVAEPMDPAHAVDGAAFDACHAVALRPGEAILEAPVAGVEGIGMEADLDHGEPILSEPDPRRNRPAAAQAKASRRTRRDFSTAERGSSLPSISRLTQPWKPASRRMPAMRL